LSIKQIASIVSAVFPEGQDPALNLPNTCAIGHVQPIWEGFNITETYCRCPDGSYGYTCTENFPNPCADGQQYHPADRRLPNNYFIECSWGTPYLFKCAKGTVWNHFNLTCDWPPSNNYDSYGQSSGYDGYSAPASGYAQPQQTYVAPQPAYAPPRPVYEAPTTTQAPYVAPQPAYEAPAQISYFQPQQSLVALSAYQAPQQFYQAPYTFNNRNVAY